MQAAASYHPAAAPPPSALRGLAPAPHPAPRPLFPRAPAPAPGASLHHPATHAAASRPASRPQPASQVARAASSSGGSGGDRAPVRSSSKAARAGNGVYVLMLINTVVFLLDHVMQLPVMRAQLYLHHSHICWWQWISHLFCHASWQHISNNMFFLLTFGRLVEDTEGSVGTVLFYIVCGIGAAVASYFLSPRNTVSCGASGAIFGLFAVSVLTRLAAGFNLRSLLESAVLGQFVIAQVMQELKSQMSGGTVLAGGMAVSHLAHLGGALAGVVLVHQLPGADPL